MSRCFPFPPPGFERKFKADDPGLLKKENQREKNPKKEKKDKEKQESKEKLEKERIDEKRREKKDKKEKHRDKKEERDLDKDEHMVNGLFPDEKRAVGPPNVHLNKFCENRKDRETDGSVTLGEKRVAGQSVFNNGESVKSNHLASHSKICKNPPGLGTRITDEERKTHNRLPNKNVSAERKKDEVVKISGTSAISVLDGNLKTSGKPFFVEKKELLGIVGEVKFSGNALGQNVLGPVKLHEKSPGLLVDGRERKEKQVIGGRVGGHAVSGDSRSSGSALPPNIIGMVRPVEKKLERKLDAEEKVREKEGDYKREKRKEENREKPIHKVKDMEKKKEDTSEQKKHVHMPSKRGDGENPMPTSNAKNESKKNLSSTLSDGLHCIPKRSIEGDVSLLGKRKGIGFNGTYDEHMTEPNKLARITASTNSLTENGRSLEPCQNSAAFAARPPMNIKAERTFAPDGTQRPPTNIKVDGKERKTGSITQSSQTTSKTHRKSEVSAKPHPDTKYHSKVLAVPKSDEWPEFDEQEWLFTSNSSQMRKPRVETPRVEEEQKVWASGLWLEPVDVFALPYVIPH